jgi:hypothetical protein
VRAKIFKILKYLGVILFSLILLSVLLVSSSVFQNFIVGKFTTSLEEELNTVVRVDDVYVNWKGELVANHIYIEDRNQDTLFYIEKIRGVFGLYNEDDHIFKLSDLKIDKAIVNFGYHSGDTSENYRFFINHFQPKKKREVPIIWTIEFEDLELINSKFNYFIEDEEAPDDRIFNENNMSFYDINGTFEDFQIIDDSLDFQIMDFSCKESCGIEVEQLTADFNIHWKGMEVKNMYLKTANSVLKDELVFQYEHWRDYGDFLEKVYITSNLNESEVSFKDLKYFSNVLHDYKYLVKTTGEFSGTVSSFDAENTTLGLLNNTVISGDFSFSGIPDISNTFMDFQLRDFVTDHRDISEFTQTNLPDNISKLGRVNYSGEVTGFLRDFVSYGVLKTALGDVTSDVNLKFNEDYTDADYSGDMVTSHFNLGEFYEINDLGKVSLHMNVDGSGLRTNNFNIDIQGKLDSIYYNRYAYSNIELEGKFSPLLFKGEANVNDPNLKLDFDGNIDFSQDKPVLDFLVKTGHANLSKLNLDSTSTHFAGSVKMDIIGLDIDDFTGTAYFDSLAYHKKSLDPILMKRVTVEANSRGEERDIVVESDALDGFIRGKFLFANMVGVARNMMHELLPLYFEEMDESVVNEDFQFKLDIKQPEIITGIFFPDLQLGRGWVKGELNSKNNNLDIKLKNNLLGYDDVAFSGVEIDAKHQPDLPMNFSGKANEFINGNSILTNEIDILANIYNDTIDYHVQALEKNDRHSLSSYGSLRFGHDTVGENIIDLEIGKTALFILQDKWFVDSTARIGYYNNLWSVDRLLITNQDQLLRFDGNISRKSEHVLNTRVNNFDLSVLNEFIPGDGLNLYGITDGTVSISSLLDVPVIISDLEIDNFILNKDTVGNVEISSKYVKNSDAIEVNALISQGLLHGISATGNIYPYRKSDNYDLKIDIPSVDIKLVENFMEGLVSDVQGKLSSELRMTGDFEEPELKGLAKIERAKFKVDYLQTEFGFSCEVDVMPDKFEFRPFKLHDIKKREGEVSGAISHTNFGNFNFDILVDNLKEFRVLNTKSKDNDLYYGVANVNGDASFSGPFGALDIALDMTSRKGTQLYIPLSDETSVGAVSYIRFKQDKSKEPVNIFSGIEGVNSLTINASVTDDAGIEMIFDEKTGDLIKGTGEGNLRMVLDNVGDFYLYGRYTIHRGDYLFTALDIFPKKFVIDHGGTIEWSGDPYQAQINLSALYNLKAAPYRLVSAYATTDEEKAIYNKPVDVVSKMYLKGNLFSPEISFDFHIPSMDNLGAGTSTNDLSRVVAQVKNEPEELNRQVFSLLIFNSFMTPTFSSDGQAGFNATTGALNTSVSELISNQVGSWLSQIDDRWQVNLQYKTETQEQRSEFVFSLGRRFLNDRLLVDGSYDATQSRTPSFNIVYSLTRDGKVKIRAYSKSTANFTYNSNVNTQGVGFIFKKEYNKSIFERKRKNRAREND